MDMNIIILIVLHLWLGFGLILAILCLPRPPKD